MMKTYKQYLNEQTLNEDMEKDMAVAFKYLMGEMEFNSYILPDTTEQELKNLVLGLTPHQQVDYTDETAIVKTTANMIDDAREIAKSAKFIVSNVRLFLPYAKTQIITAIATGNAFVTTEMDKQVLRKWSNQKIGSVLN
jgi:hypothetical protein